jgi:diguanylate cyclase (GGDEF)-like protein
LNIGLRNAGSRPILGDRSNAAALRAEDMADTPPNILLVDDDAVTIQLLARILHGLGNLRFATDGAEALRLAREAAPDLILLDAQMPGMGGFEVLRALKAEAALAQVPVIFVTSQREPAFEVAGFEAGAVDFITKPVNAPLVIARIRAQLRVKAMADELRRISATDALTGVANRRCFDEAIDREWRRAQRSGEPIALLLADVDHFKAYNDRYGHPAGDVCLRRIAAVLRSVSLRPADVVARVGGEEFAVILPQTPRQGAEQMARRCLAAVDALAIAHEASPVGARVSVSLGIACHDEAGAARPEDSRFGETHSVRRSAGDLVLAADRALYAAKHAGRAQARLLGLADLEAPQLAREVAPFAAAAAAPSRG